MRTDRTTLCAACAVRFPASDRCPRCEGTELFDLTRPRARRKAFRAVQRPRPHRRGRPWQEILATVYIKYGVVLLTAVGAFAGWKLGETWIAAFVIGLAAFWAALALFFVLGGLAYVVTLVLRILAAVLWLLVSWVTDRAHHVRRRIVAIDDQLLLPSMDVHELRGRVRAVESLRSPLHHGDCVAWRVRGEGPVGDVDDAQAVPFEVVLEDDEDTAVRVEAPPASVALEVEEDPRAVRPDLALVRFLESRGVYPDRGPVRLAESRLQQGERVAIEGALERVTEPEGYRGDRQRLVLRERPGAPLVIRRI